MNISVCASCVLGGLVVNDLAEFNIFKVTTILHERLRRQGRANWRLGISPLQADAHFTGGEVD